ncbi:hypothetical protein VOLCADRAFT_120645 [Volvox carteri f. nagariensis]|uniref:LsmAD domain-containing protein n=1 Tax=Volvox carteri f. nagariensis TaxID=3068 RepID=D8TQ60_VOLCA|nr:uncharacterized protein VOLCADRAFT_120645 [Volvox carteri f. nagariensis]EFJ50477.1 hypothetical protein VOLCADRAFT_120645 [Volvox carteri f. nagariensis]|eukprot:XP_002948602.1 hypothetical protein VOLCADRAFT_120645 [Volvox carteri f. nagariensis]
MSTYLAKAVGGQPRGGGPQQHHQQTAGGLQHNGAVKSNPARQTVGFSVASNADRLGFIGNVLIGYKVEAQVSSGMVYEGVFGSLHNDSTGVSFILKYAKVIKNPTTSSDRNALAEKPVPILTIPAADLVQLYAKDVRLSAEDLSGADRSDVGFETDAAISRGRGGCVRELQRWQPDEGDDSAFFSLESANDSTGWDQFAVNRDRFGVQTTWNEHFYTTKINPEECRISEAEAQRIAKEIEQGNTTSTTNIHLLEERGGELSVDVDEEALYGAVIRDEAPGPYQHPNHHQQQQRRQQHQARAPQQSVPERVAAWGRAGSGVAAVAGGLATAQQHHQQQQHHQHQTQRGNLSGGGLLAVKATSVPVPVPSAPASVGGAAPTPDTGSGSAGSSTAGATAPIDIDPRKEVNKVRSSLTTWPKKDRSSPYGTPRLGMSRSPVFASPLVGDPVSFSALDLDPGAPQQVRLDPEAQAEFLRFKEEQNKKRLGQMGADLKKAASSSFKERAPLAAGNGTAAAPSGAESAPAAAAATVPAATADAPASAAAAAAAAAAAVASLVAGPAHAAVASPAVPASSALPTPAPPAAPAPAATPAVINTAAAPAATADGMEGNKPKLSSKLNPNAKPFSLNINAKEFVPSFAMKSAPPSVTVAPTAPTATTASSTPAAPATRSTSNSVAMGAPAAVVTSSVSAASAATVAAVAASSAAAAAAASASNVPSAPPAAAAAAAQAATTAVSSGQMSYIPGAGAHGLTVTYHHSSSAHSHGHGHGGSQQAHYGHAGQGSGLHMGHGHAALHHERGGYGGGGNGSMTRELREHGGMYHRSGDSFRSTISDGVGGGGYRGGSGGDPFRTGAGSGSGDGYHHHHHQYHHKAGGGAAAEHHMVNKAADPHSSAAGALHKVPPPPPQGPMAAEGPMGPIISVAPATMAPHHVIGAMAPMTAAGMAPMGYSMVLQAGPGGSYVASAMPPGTVAIPATTSGGMPIIGYVARPPAGTPITAVTPGLAMMGAPGMTTPYGAPVGPYMTAAPGTMPPPSPTGRPPSTGYFQPAGTYPMIATAAHPGGPHGHAHAHAASMGGQPAGPMAGHHLMSGPAGHGHGHGPGHMTQHQHLQDGRGPLGPGGPKGIRQGGRPPRMDHDRMARDLD